MIRNKIQALWFDHKPVWKAHRKIFESESKLKKLKAAYSSLDWSRKQDEKRMQNLLEENRVLYQQIDGLQRTIKYLCRGYDALATALIARGGDPNQVHPEAPPADR